MNAISEINSLVKTAQQMMGRVNLAGTSPTLKGASPARRRVNPVQPGGNAVQGSGTGFRAGAPNVATQTATPMPTVNAATPKSTMAQTPTAKPQPQFDFNQEAMKILKPLKRDFKSRPGAYSDQAEGRINEMARGFRATLADMKRNPQNYNEQRKRQILRDWKRQVSGFRGYLPNESKTVNGAPRYDAKDPRWQQVGRGIHIIPRSYSENNTFQQNWAALGDRSLVNNYKANQRFNDLMRIANDAIARNPAFRATARRRMARRG